MELSVRGGAALATRIGLSTCHGAQQRAHEQGGQTPWCAFVDPSASLHGPGVARAGVTLERLLVVRPPLSALSRVALRIVESKAFAVVVIDTAKEGEEARPICFANPEIVWSSEEKRVYQEGCLSIPEYYEDVERPSRVKARYLDREGRENEIEADGLLATALQHEIDHLNGVLFIDHLSRLKRERVWKKYEKIARRNANEPGHPAHDSREL